MIRDLYKNLINDIYVEHYKSKGWKKQGSNYRLINNSGLGKIVNFQQSRWNDSSNIEFYINYGLYMEADDKITNKLFKEYECQFRSRALLKDGNNCINKKTNYEIIKNNVLESLKRADVLFDEIPNKQMFITRILDKTLEKESGIPLLHYDTCKLLSDMGYYKEIYKYVKNRGTYSFDSLADEIEAKMKK